MNYFKHMVEYLYVNDKLPKFKLICRVCRANIFIWTKSFSAYYVTENLLYITC